MTSGTDRGVSGRPSLLPLGHATPPDLVPLAAAVPCSACGPAGLCDHCRRVAGRVEREIRRRQAGGG
jgi:hypothetical protein